MATTTSIPTARATFPRSDLELRYVDAELKRRVANFLLERDVPGAGELAIEAHSGVVTLRGELPSPQAKRLCTDCALRVAGVIRLIDELTFRAQRTTSAHSLRVPSFRVPAGHRGRSSTLHS